jgi:hypothetical protein
MIDAITARAGAQDLRNAGPAGVCGGAAILVQPVSL